MTAWHDYTAADFDRSRARKGTRARSAEPGLFHVATPVERPAKSAADRKSLPDDIALFSDEDTTGPASVPRGAMCRCSAPATGPVICADGQDRYLCDDCREAEIRACHERDPRADALGHPVCRKCGQALHYRPEIHRDVTVTSNNAECYGRRS